MLGSCFISHQKVHRLRDDCLKLGCHAKRTSFISMQTIPLDDYYYDLYIEDTHKDWLFLVRAL